MKKIENMFAILFLMFAAATLTVSALDSFSAAGTTEETASPAQKAPAKKQIKKKNTKKVKKTTHKPASEYIFNGVSTIPTYKFDKKANPIIKEIKPKKKTGKSAKGKSAASKSDVTPSAQQKLKVQPPLDGGQQQPPGDQQQQSNQEGE